MSVPKLTLRFSQGRRRWPAYFLLTMLLTAVATWWLNQPWRPVGPVTIAAESDKAPTLPAKAPPEQAVLLQGMRHHPWRLLSALNDTQVAGIRVTALSWPGSGKPIRIMASTEQYEAMQRWQQKLNMRFSGVSLSSVSPQVGSQAINFTVEMQWPH